jgi:hypothetical protein
MRSILSDFQVTSVQVIANVSTGTTLTKISTKTTTTFMISLPSSSKTFKARLAWRNKTMVSYSRIMFTFIKDSFCRYFTNN